MFSEHSPQIHAKETVLLKQVPRYCFFSQEIGMLKRRQYEYNRWQVYLYSLGRRSPTSADLELMIRFGESRTAPRLSSNTGIRGMPTMGIGRHWPIPNVNAASKAGHH